MAISALGLNSSWFQTALPAVLFNVEHSQIAVILLAVIASENIELVLVKGGCVVLNLRRLDRLASTSTRDHPDVTPALFSWLAYQHPLQLLLWLGPKQQGRLIGRIIAM